MAPEDRARSALISVGVFLALMGEQWRESAHTREVTEASLRGFQAEIVANQKAVAAVKDYHVALLASLRAYLATDQKSRRADSVEIRGLQPVFFEHTAWDLALATQSLAHIDSQVAFGLSRAYGLQRTYMEQTRGIMQAIYLRPLTENVEGLERAVDRATLWKRRRLYYRSTGHVRGRAGPYLDEVENSCGARGSTRGSR
jgi:hypothetical protein